MIGTAALLSFVFAAAYSLLGERFLSRLHSSGELSAADGATIRIAWHIVSVAMIGLGSVLAILRWGPEHPHTAIVSTVATVFLVSAAIAGIGSRGRNPAWLVLLVLAGLSFAGA